MPDAVFTRNWDARLLTAAAAYSVGEVLQLADGSAAVYRGKPVGAGIQEVACSSGDRILVQTSGEYTITKTTSVVLLDGGRAYWDHSANSCTYKRANDRDFYIGRVVGDAASASTTAVVNLNADPPDTLDLARDAFDTSITGTQGLNTMGLFRRGGAHKIILSATNEVQKVDMLSKDGFALDANAIIEFAFDVIDDGAGTAVDVSLGVANDTHATDADSITDAIFLHLDANDTTVNFESDDGTTEVAATDASVTYTLGTRHEVWIDMRDPADVQIYFDGANVLPATTFDVSASVATWKLLAHVEKTAAADIYEIDLDFFRARTMEQ